MNHPIPAISSHLCSIAFLFSTVLSGAARAIDARVMPSNPQLGDTLVVSIETETPAAPNPTVTVNGQTYPSFAVGTQRFRAFLPTNPLESPGGRTLQVSGDGQVKNLSVEVGNRDFPIQEIWLSEETNAIQGTDYEFDRVQAFRGLETSEQFWKGVFLQPADGYISTEYGVRRYYNGEWAADYYHRGLDFAAYEGSPVRASADGRIGLVGRVSDGFELHGNTVGIDHGQGVTTMYLHLSEIEVSEGQMVRAGDIIGRVGSTGISTGPHLHWGLYVQGVSVDPMPWLERGFK
ncbi:MAG: M23 family metallopeptidase [Geitlerinemataceae cyanobacterium]